MNIKIWILILSVILLVIPNPVNAKSESSVTSYKSGDTKKEQECSLWIIIKLPVGETPRELEDNNVVEYWTPSNNWSNRSGRAEVYNTINHAYMDVELALKVSNLSDNFLGRTIFVIPLDNEFRDILLN